MRFSTAIFTNLAGKILKRIARNLIFKAGRDLLT
jgi:hypothetical protein